jgi:hypothetical protein
MFSINGILKFRPGVRMRWYLPNMVITAIVPCLTVTNEENITIRVKNPNTKRSKDEAVIRLVFLNKYRLNYK